MQAERNHPKPGEQPNDILARAKGIVAEAKGIHVPTEISEEGKHGPGMMLLREAKDLVAKDLPKQNKFPSMADYARFIDREGMIRRGDLAEALEARRNEGKEASALGAPAEVKAEGVRPGEGGERLAEVSPEEEVIHREEEEEQAKEQEKEVAGEPRKLTENERRAQEASERARAKLAEREAPRERPTVTRESDEEPMGPLIAGRHYMTGKTAVGFKVEKTRPKWKKQEGESDEDKFFRWAVEQEDKFRKDYGKAPRDSLVTKINEAFKQEDDKRIRELMDEFGWKKQEGKSEEGTAQEPKLGEGYRHLIEIGGQLVRPSRSETAADAIKRTYGVGKYAAGAPQIMGKLRGIVEKIAGDTPVHYVTDAEMNKIMNFTGDGHVYGAFSDTGWMASRLSSLTASICPTTRPCTKRFMPLRCLR